MLLLIDDIHLSEVTEHVNPAFSTGPRVTNMVLSGDLVPAGTM